MTTIKLKNGSGAPIAADLVQGEPALDLTNKRLYTEDSSGTVIEVGTNPTSLNTGAITSTSLNVNGTIEFDGLSGTGSVAVTDILDEDNMSSNSATALATQQSIKSYVDSQVTAQDLDVTSDSGTIAIDLDSEILSIVGGEGICLLYTSPSPRD